MQRTGWSHKIADCIGSMAEAEIYMRARLREAVVDGRPALIRTDIDWAAFNCRAEWLRQKFADYKKWVDYNNADLIGEGYPPRDCNGDPYELHHIGQRQDSPFAELTWAEHMGDGNNTILHRAGKESEIDRGLFDEESRSTGRPATASSPRPSSTGSTVRHRRKIGRLAQSQIVPAFSVLPPPRRGAYSALSNSKCPDCSPKRSAVSFWANSSIMCFFWSSVMVYSVLSHVTLLPSRV